jgi:hypothetical protein
MNEVGNTDVIVKEYTLYTWLFLLVSSSRIYGNFCVHQFSHLQSGTDINFAALL